MTPAGDSTRSIHIQGLRGVAVSLVVLDHAFGVPRGGFVGVDVFFVISGYVITMSLLREHTRSGFIDLGGFIGRRLRRLVPSAALVVLTTVMLSFALFFTPRALAVLGDGVGSLLSVQNWRLARAGADYFSEAAESSPFLHFWSLSVEEQFYAVWPLLFVALIGRRRPRHRRLLIAVVILVLASLTVAAIETALRPSWAYYSTEARAWEIGVGVLVALAVANHTIVLNLTAATAVWWAGALSIAVAAFTTAAGSMPMPGALLAVGGTAALILAGESASPPRARRVLEARALVHLGEMSYPLYLWHYPAIVSLASLWPGSGIVAVTAVALSYALAAVTHVAVERPALRRRSARPRQPRRRLRSGVAALCIVGTLSVATARGPAVLVEDPELASAAATHAAPFADDIAIEQAVASATLATDWSGLSPSPDALWRATGAAAAAQDDLCLVAAEMLPTTIDEMVESCASGEDGADHLAVVVGDSIATSWLPAVRGALDGSEWRVVGIGAESCPPFTVAVADRTGRGDFASRCADARNAAMEAVDAIAADLVVLSSAEGSFSRLAEEHGMDAAGRLWHDGVATAVSSFTATGADVVVLASPPETAAVAQCGTRLTDPSSCVEDVSATWVAKSDAERDASVYSGARYVDTFSWFCTTDGCPPFADGTMMRVDHGHLTTEYSARLSFVMRDQLLR